MFCSKKVSYGKILISALAFALVSFIVNEVAAVMQMNYYLLPDYFTVWSKVMMPIAGPPPTSFYVISFIFSLVTGLVVASLYGCVNCQESKKYWQTVICFTCLLASLSLVFFYLPTYLLINLPLMLLVDWFIGSVITFFLSSLILVRIMK